MEEQDSADPFQLLRVEGIEVLGERRPPRLFFHFQAVEELVECWGALKGVGQFTGLVRTRLLLDELVFDK